MVLPVIDTATSQRNLDFRIPFGLGFRDGYVKMGGDNVDTYVAPWYKSQIDRGRACGWGHAGHYWVPDANPADPDPIDTPTQQALWMVERLYDWRRDIDFIVLDNEALDGAWMFTDAGASEFIDVAQTELRITGLQTIMYGGWYDLAAHEWPLTLATGARFLVADYRTNSQPGMNFPDLPTIPRDRIIGHQYGQRDFGGVLTDVNAFVDGAFDWGGGDMGSLESKAREFAARYPRASDHPYGATSSDGSWDQMCGNLVNRFGEYTSPGWAPRITGPTAWNVALESGPRNLDPARAPAGAIHWWRNRTSSGTPGHTAVDLNGGGRDTLMATWGVRESLGSAIGIQSVAGYSRAKTFMQYMGWTTNYAGARFAVASTAGGGYTPIEKEVADVATHTRFQNANDYTVRSHFQDFPVSPGQTNIAGGPGPGLYDILINLYLRGFAPDARVEGKLVLENASTGARSDGYMFTLDGSRDGIVRTAVPARIKVPTGFRLFLAMRSVVPEGTAEPVVDVLGVDVANLTVA